MKFLSITFCVNTLNTDEKQETANIKEDIKLNAREISGCYNHLPCRIEISPVL